MAALLAARGGIDGLDPDYLFSGINMGTNTGHSILHSGTVGAALTAATFGLSGLAVSLAVSEPMAWESAYAYVEEAIGAARAAPRATVLNVNVPVPQGRLGAAEAPLGRPRPLRLVPGGGRREARGGGAARVPGDGDGAPSSTLTPTPCSWTPAPPPSPHLRRSGQSLRDELPFGRTAPGA